MPYDRQGRWYPEYGEGGEYEPYYGQPDFAPEESASGVHSRFRFPHEIGPIHEPTFEQLSRRRGAYYGVGPAGYRRSDERILEDVADALARDSWLDASGIHVSVKDQAITLEGTVDSPAARRRADLLSWGVLGARDVQNRLRVGRIEQAGTSQGAGETPNA